MIKRCFFAATGGPLLGAWLLLFGGRGTGAAAFVSPLPNGGPPSKAAVLARHAKKNRAVRSRGGGSDDDDDDEEEDSRPPRRRTMSGLRKVLFKSPATAAWGRAKRAVRPRGGGGAELAIGTNKTTEQEPTLDVRRSREIISSLKALYRRDVLPVERRFNLHSFCLPTNGEIQDAEFDARPMVLLIGQYSTGKTTFIRHLLGGGFPGMHIGPEPTTDKFTALIHGDCDDDGDDGNGPVPRNDAATHDIGVDPASEEEGDAAVGENDDAPSNGSGGSVKGRVMDSPRNVRGRIIKGNSLTVTPELPFSSLSQFGGAFLDHFVGSLTDAPLLRRVTLIDTPGVLSGEKQRLNRSYDFAKVAKWFADRSDLILLLFDADKLDVSDELKDVVETIRRHNDDKIRCVLNKADGVSREQLVRVYGSLMWSMGKLFSNPEVVRVYAGSFWDEPLSNDDFREMFDADESLLIRELTDLPSCSAERKVNQMVKRIRLVKVHLCVLSYLRQQMRWAIGKAKKRRWLIANLDGVFERVRRKYDLPVGDMPSIDEFASCLLAFDNFSSFPHADQKLLQTLDDLVDRDIPGIMKGNVGVTNDNSRTSS